MEHFSHEHPLIFINEQSQEVRQLCHGCRETTSGPFYGCGQCRIYSLHQVCAELPKEMKHPMHPQHPLSLLRLPPPHCDPCNFCYNSSILGFVYHCSPCRFTLDIKCASLAHRIKLKCHQHPLTPLLQEASFLCAACDTEHKGVSYKCDICPFWVNQSCAMKPDTVKHPSHDHHLILAYSIPDEYAKFRTSDDSCDICDKSLSMMNWVYYCAGCRYFAHIFCATSIKEASRDVHGESFDFVGPFNLVHLPEPNESVDLITNLLRRVDWLYRTCSPKEIPFRTRLGRVGHDHPLTLFNEQLDNELSLLCEACVQPISAPPFYSCTECNYLLHKCCAELPTRIRHRCHKHPLDLLPKALENFGVFFCGFCMKPCNGFSYKCGQCEYFYLDVKCGSLPENIKHEAYTKFLSPMIASSTKYCIACQEPFLGLGLACPDSRIIIDTRCLMLPPTVEHRYDEHPFILQYSPIKDHPAEYYCEICCEEVNPKLWFYHCCECDQSMHAVCVHKYLLDSNLRFGKSFEVDWHPHPLTFNLFNSAGQKTLAATAAFGTAMSLMISFCL